MSAIEQVHAEIANIDSQIADNRERFEQAATHQRLALEAIDKLNTLRAEWVALIPRCEHGCTKDCSQCEARASE